MAFDIFYGLIFVLSLMYFYNRFNRGDKIMFVKTANIRSKFLLLLLAFLSILISVILPFNIYFAIMTIVELAKESNKPQEKQ